MFFWPQRAREIGFTLATKLSFSHACEEYARKTNGKTLDLMKNMRSLGRLNTSVFVQLFDAQVKPMLLYASVIWGTFRLSVIESAYLFACKRLLCVSDKKPNHIMYGETGRYPLYIERTICSLRYWLKLRAMHISIFPKQALTMLQNDLEANHYIKYNWAGDIKVCLNS